MKKSKVTFSKEGLPFILEALGYNINRNGFVIKSANRKPALDKYDNKILAKNVVGMVKDEDGKTLFLTERNFWDWAFEMKNKNENDKEKWLSK